MIVKKIMIFVVVLIGVIYFLGWHLQPFESKFFSFHDDTQVGRMREFAFSLKNLQIPPRLAPHFSFGMGFPVFNFYAPFSYWIAGLFNVVGIPIVVAAKSSLFLALLTIFVSMFLFISTILTFEAGIVAATVYASSTWIATEIFARGNVGEVWFIALLPLALYFLEKNSKSNSILYFILTTIIVSFSLTSHNVLSLVGFFLLLCYCFAIKSRKRNLLAVLFALLLSSYYYVPLIFEAGLTYAKTQAEKTPYMDHFLCTIQLWSSSTWELGGSGAGCNDGMSFKLGKIHLILGLLGFISWIISSIFHQKPIQKENRRFYVISIFGLLSLFMMFSISSFLWKMFSFVLAPFQFPWRFNSFFLFFIAVFSGYFVSLFKFKEMRFFVLPVSLLIIIAMLISSRPYFRHPWRLSYDEYYSKYVTDEYIYKKIAYAIPEYLPKDANYDKWMNYRNRTDAKAITADYLPFIGDKQYISLLINLPYEKKMISRADQNIIINTIYFPFWEISINDKKIIPKSFDSLGRPIIFITKSSVLSVRYKETFIEIIGNYGTILTIVGLGIFLFKNKLWKKMNTILQ